jgi:hypothetical protein
VQNPIRVADPTPRGCCNTDAELLEDQKTKQNNTTPKAALTHPMLTRQQLQQYYSHYNFDLDSLLESHCVRSGTI